jgi:hypothetical protein
VVRGARLWDKGKKKGTILEGEIFYCRFEMFCKGSYALDKSLEHLWYGLAFLGPWKEEGENL